MYQHTVRLFTLDPVSSVAMVTSDVVVDDWVDGTVVVNRTIQYVRIDTTLGRNGRGHLVLKHSPDMYCIIRHNHRTCH